MILMMDKRKIEKTLEVLTEASGLHSLPVLYYYPSRLYWTQEVLPTNFLMTPHSAIPTRGLSKQSVPSSLWYLGRCIQ